MDQNPAEAQLIQLAKDMERLQAAMQAAMLVMKANSNANANPIPGNAEGNTANPGLVAADAAQGDQVVGGGATAVAGYTATINSITSLSKSIKDKILGETVNFPGVKAGVHKFLQNPTQKIPDCVYTVLCTMEDSIFDEVLQVLRTPGA
eukprot:GDKK01005165.1.p2 GENE.GDKK01005165.1~~GDKK01005165.1.p2  ORF type:complete len:149 (+),score=27.47 GDKK01005165.1:98-544(+)